jgi:hypothetical protein
MTVGTTSPQRDYIENGFTTVHAIPFQFQSSSEIVCSRIINGVENVLVLGVGYNVTGGGGGLGSVTKTNGGTVGATFRIKRNTTRAQPTVYPAHGDFPAGDVETSEDRLAMVNQEQDRDKLDLEGRSLRVPPGEAISPFDPAPARSNKFIRWSASGLVADLLNSAQMAIALAGDMTTAIGSYLKGDPGSPGEGYSTRGAMALAGNTAANLNDAYLTEGSRWGKFIFYSAAGFLLNFGYAITTLVSADPAQGLSVPAQSDGTGANGAWVRAGLGNFADTKWFDVKGNSSPAGIGGANDSPAINTAIVTMHDLFGGGELFFSGHHRCAEPLDLDHRNNIQLTGAGGGTGTGYSAPPPTQLIFTGTGSGSFLSAQSSSAIRYYNMGIRYTSGAFTGRLIDFTHSVSLVDAAYMKLDRCLIGGIGVASAVLVDLAGAIAGRFVDCSMLWGTVGFSGRVAVGGGVTYSNSHTFENITSSNLTLGAYRNPGDSWLIINPTIEGTDGGTGGMPRFLFDDLPNFPALTNGLTIICPWAGDGVNVPDAWITNGFTEWRDFKIIGGTLDTGFSGNTPGIKFTAKTYGTEISTSMTGALDLGNVDHDGMVLLGGFNAAGVINLSAGSNDLWCFGNVKDGGLAETIIRVSKPQEMALGNAGNSGVYADVTGIASISRNVGGDEIKLGIGTIGVLGAVPSARQAVITGDLASTQAALVAFGFINLI